MSYCVIIPSKTDSNLIPCLTQLRKHEPSCPIVVVDDGLSVQAIDQARFCEPIEIVKGVKPFVFARNVNMGIRRALVMSGNVWEPPDSYIILNDDALLESADGFRLLSDCCYFDKSIGCIGATTNLTGQPLQQRRGVVCPKCQSKDTRFKYDNHANYTPWGCNFCGTEFGGPGLRIVPHIAFVAVCIPQTTIDRIGMLDEDFCEDYGCEDRSYCEAIARAGMKTAVHDGCFVDHSKLHSSFRGNPEAPGSFQKNYAILMRKWGGKLITDGPQQGGAR